MGRDGQSVDINSLKKHYNELLEIVRSSFLFYKDHPEYRNEHVKYKARATYFTAISYLLQLEAHGLLPDIRKIIKDLDTFLKDQVPDLYRYSWNNKKLALLRLTDYRMVKAAAYIENRKF